MRQRRVGQAVPRYVLIETVRSKQSGKAVRYIKYHPTCVKAGHVNPKNLLVGKMGTVYPRPNVVAQPLGFQGWKIKNRMKNNFTSFSTVSFHSQTY